MTSTPAPTLPELLATLGDPTPGSGHRAAAEILLGLLRRLMARIVAKRDGPRLHDGTLAAEVVQEVAIKVVQRVRAGERPLGLGEKVALAYMYRMLDRRLLDHLRTLTEDDPLDEARGVSAEAESDAPFDVARAENFLAAAAEAAIEALPEVNRSGARLAWEEVRRMAAGQVDIHGLVAERGGPPKDVDPAGLRTVQNTITTAHRRQRERMAIAAAKLQGFDDEREFWLANAVPKPRALSDAAAPARLPLDSPSEPRTRRGPAADGGTP